MLLPEYVQNAFPFSGNMNLCVCVCVFSCILKGIIGVVNQKNHQGTAQKRAYLSKFQGLRMQLSNSSAAINPHPRDIPQHCVIVQMDRQPKSDSFSSSQVWPTRPTHLILQQ